MDQATAMDFSETGLSKIPRQNQSQYLFREAKTSEDYNELYKLSYQVYCIENNWLPFRDHPDELETDEYDAFAKHFVAEDAEGRIIGTIRLIPAGHLPENKYLPVCKHPSVDAALSTGKMSAEISRLVVDRKMRRGDIALGLYRIMYQYSCQLGIDEWFVVVDEIF